MQTTSSYAVRYLDLSYALDTQQYSSLPCFRWNIAECALWDSHNMEIRIPQYLYHDIWEIKCVYIHVCLYQQFSKRGKSKDGAVKWLRERERERERDSLAFHIGGIVSTADHSMWDLC